MRASTPLLLTLGLIACGGVDAASSSPPVQPPAVAEATAEAQAITASSPLPHLRPSNCAGIPAETEIRVEGTTRGAALVFSTDDDIAALREQMALRLAGLSWSDAHLDNVDKGVRIVFESADDQRSQLRASVMQRGRELTKVCGLAWNIPNDALDKAAAVDASASAVKPEPTASADNSKPEVPPTSETKKPTDENTKVKPAASAKPPVPKPSAKPAEKPKETIKPKPLPLPPPPPELPPPPAPPPPRPL